MNNTYKGLNIKFSIDVQPINTQNSKSCFSLVSKSKKKTESDLKVIDTRYKVKKPHTKLYYLLLR